MNDSSGQQEGTHRRAGAREFPVFPGYRVLGILGRGGMGTIYRAVQEGMDRPVAIKVIRADLAKKAISIERLQREARVAGRLDHPQIVKGIEVGEHDGRHYFVMEYVDGRSLKSVLKSRGVLDEEDVIELGVQIARGLAHAHAHGIIHRDIKPGNILVTPEGSFKLTDLGLARGPEDPTLTLEGATVGTPQYMPPEQANDPDAVDRRSDIYSLGATLFHALTGRPPFQAETIGQLLTKVLRDPAPDPVRVRPEVSEGLALVLRKTLSKEPSRRYPSAAALLADLQRVRDHLPPRVRAGALDDLEPRWGVRIAAAATGLILVFLLGWFLWPRDEGEPEVPEPPRDLAAWIKTERSERDEAAGAASRPGAENVAQYRRLQQHLAPRDEPTPRDLETVFARLDETRKGLERLLIERMDAAVEAAIAALPNTLDEDLEGRFHAEILEAFGSLLGSLPPALQSRGGEHRGRFEKSVAAVRTERKNLRRREVLENFERFVREDAELAGQFNDGAFLAAKGNLETELDVARGRLGSIVEGAELQSARKELEATADAFREELRGTAQARIDNALTELDRVAKQLREGTLDLGRLEERDPREWLDAILESQGLDPAGNLPPELRPERDPFRLRDLLANDLGEAQVARQEERAELAWLIARAHLDVMLPRRRFGYAVEYLDEKARGEIAGGPVSHQQLQDRRNLVVGPLADLQRAFDSEWRRRMEVGERVRLLMNDGSERRGIPRMTGVEEALRIGKADPFPWREVAPESVIEIAGRPNVALVWLIRFTDLLDTPEDPEVAQVLAALQGLGERELWHALRDWIEERRASWRERSEETQRALALAFGEVDRLAGEGRYEDALAHLEEVSIKFAGKPELLLSGFDERHRELSTQRRDKQIEEQVRASLPRGATVAIEHDAESGLAMSHMSFDLTQRELAANLELDLLPGWSWSSSSGLHRTATASSLREVDKGAELNLGLESLDVDLGIPVRVFLDLRCPYDSGRPFFGAFTFGEWTLGFVGGSAALPFAIDADTPGFDALGFEAGLSWPGSDVFLARGRGLRQVFSVLSRSAPEPRNPVIWTQPFSGWMRGAEHRLELRWSEGAERLQVFLDGASDPILDARPERIRPRHLGKIMFRSFEPVQLHRVEIRGRVR